MVKKKRSLWRRLPQEFKVLLLRQLAETEKLTAAEIANRLKVTRATVVTGCRRYRIPLVDGRRRQNRSTRPVRIFVPPTEPATGITFQDLTKHHCRYPLWGNARVTLNQKRYCGEPTRDGAPFCAKHAAMVHRTEDGD